MLISHSNLLRTIYLHIYPLLNHKLWIECGELFSETVSYQCQSELLAEIICQMKLDQQTLCPCLCMQWHIFK